MAFHAGNRFVRLRPIFFVVFLNMVAFWGGWAIYVAVMTGMILHEGPEWAKRHGDPNVIFALQLGLAAGLGTWIGQQPKCPDKAAFVYGSLVFVAFNWVSYFYNFRFALWTIGVPFLLSRLALRRRKALGLAVS